MPSKKFFHFLESLGLAALFPHIHSPLMRHNELTLLAKTQQYYCEWKDLHRFTQNDNDFRKFLRSLDGKRD